MNTQTYPAAGPDMPLASRCARALMDRHGIPRYRQSPWLADAFGLSYSQAHRRMNGVSPWTLDDLELLASKFGESLAQVVTLQSDDGMVTGIMQLGPATSIDCNLWLGDPIQDPSPDAFVATRTGALWVAQLAGRAGAGAGVAHRIKRLEATPTEGIGRLIAILDDDPDVTDSVCAHLVANRFRAHPFYKTADLAAAAKAQHYDGYLIDWIVGDSSTQELITSLRAADPSCPIIVLTAHVTSGAVEEAAIADVVQRLHVTFSEKPLRLSILSATLARALGAPRSA